MVSGPDLQGGTQMSSAAEWEQELFVGGHIFFDVSAVHLPWHLIEGQVLSLDEKMVVVQPERRW
jgi:hypothetical protein